MCSIVGYFTFRVLRDQCYPRSKRVVCPHQGNIIHVSAVQSNTNMYLAKESCITTTPIHTYYKYVIESTTTTHKLSTSRLQIQSLQLIRSVLTIHNLRWMLVHLDRLALLWRLCIRLRGDPCLIPVFHALVQCLNVRGNTACPVQRLDFAAGDICCFFSNVSLHACSICREKQRNTMIMIVCCLD